MKATLLFLVTPGITHTPTANGQYNDLSTHGKDFAIVVIDHQNQLTGRATN